MPKHLSGLVAQLRGEETSANIDAMLAHLENVTDEERAAIGELLRGRVQGIATSLEDLIVEDDDAEARIVLPWIWLELRFEWMRYNAQMQYQTAFRGLAEPALMAQGAALSGLIATLERWLPPEEAFFVTKVAADPLATARAELVRNQRLFDVLGAADRGGGDAVGALLGAQEAIARVTEDDRVHALLDGASAEVMERVGGRLQVSLDDFRIAFEARLVTLLANSPVHVTLQPQFDDPLAGIPSAAAEALLQVLEQWIGALLPSVGSGDDRLAAGRPAHVTLQLTMSLTSRDVDLTLADDGAGAVPWAPDRSGWLARDMHVAVEQRPGEGSTIRLSCGLRSVGDFLVVAAGAGEHDATIAIPLDSVERMETREAGALTLHGEAVQAGSGDVLPVVDLGERLYRDSSAGDTRAVFVIVRRRDEQRLALRVRELRGTCRGALKGMPEACDGAPLRGFVMDRRRLVGVLDLERLAA